LIFAACGERLELSPDAGIKEDAGSGIVGLVKNERAEVIGNAIVLACTKSYCYMGRSKSDGSFFFPVEPPVRMIMKVAEDRASSPRRAEGIQPLQIIDNSLVETGTIYCPTLGAGAALGPARDDPQTLALGDGLELTLRRADLTPVLGISIENLAARAVPAERRPRFEELDGEELIAVYALFPFGTTSASPIGAKVPSDLADGTVVHFRTVEELDGALSAPAAGRADGAFVSTDPGQGILKLTWLIVSRP
jgi:hypothetical protein